MIKIYNAEDKTYDNKKYDILDIKLQVFYDYCAKIKLLELDFGNAFSIILKRQVSEFYYNKIVSKRFGYTKIIDIMKKHFKTKKNRQKYLSK